MTHDGDSLQTGESVSWEPPDVHPDLDRRHPRVFCTQDAIERAHENVSSGKQWAERIHGNVLAEADATPWLAFGDEEIREYIPEPGSYFQFENVSTLCPLDGTKLTALGWESPRTVRCEEGHVFPDDDHPDDGTGWEAQDGSTQYFLALWNGFVVEDLTRAIEPLALAYALTGEQRYARTVAVALDALATTYPTAIEGPINFPTTSPGVEGGRLTRPGYQVPRTLLKYVSAFDLVAGSGAFDRPSGTNPGLTMAENVAVNMLINGADFCERNMQERGYDRLLHNGTADYVRGLLAVGSLLGIDRYVEWAVNGRVSIDSMLANNVDRDGCYYETAVMYSDHARRLYLSIAEILYNLRCESHPNGIDLYDDPRFERFYVGARERLAVAGRLPHYGDTGPEPDVSIVPGDLPLTEGKTTTSLVPDHTTASFADIDSNREIFDQTVRFYARAESPEKRAEIARRLVALVGDDPERELNDVWALLYADGISTDGVEESREPSGSTLAGGPGVAVLRPEHGHDRGALFRYGPTLSHGHADELGVNLYAANREMTYDPGYGKAHYRNGWCRQTVAHATAVVDEHSQLSTDSPGGSLNYFSTGDGVSVVDASDEDAYDIDRYRRTLAMIDSSPEESYFVDIFRVAGGETRDYSMHGLGINFETEGLDLSEPATGSLAGEDRWGERVRGDGARHGDGKIPGRENEDWGWEPPGQGYGFLANPRYANGESLWSATWSDTREPTAKLRLTMLPELGREVVVADAPAPMSEQLGETAERVNYVLARDTGSDPSQFVSVIEGSEDEFHVEAVEPLPVTDSMGDGIEEPVALAVGLSDRRDYIGSTITDAPFTASADERAFETDGGFALVRTDGSGVERLRLVRGTHLKTDGIALSGVPREYAGTVREVDEETTSVVVDTVLPEGRALAGEQVSFDAPEYSHNSPYPIDRIEREGDGSRLYLTDSTLELSRGTVAGPPDGDVLPNETFLSLARNSVHLTEGDSNRYFDGKQVVNRNGTETTITAVEDDAATLVVEETAGFAAGDGLVINDVAAGDEFVIPVSASVRRTDRSTYEVAAPEPVCLTVSGSAPAPQAFLRDGSGGLLEMDATEEDGTTVFGGESRD